MEKAQGTIEYLVIVAVLVIAGLLVTVIATTFTDTTGPSSGIQKINSLVGSTITVSDSYINSDGEGGLNIKNLVGENIILEKISTGTKDNEYNKLIMGGEELTLLLGELSEDCPCTGQSKVICTFEIFFQTQSGISKSITKTIEVDCSETDTIVDPVNPTNWDHTPPIITLTSPTETVQINTCYDDTIDIEFSVTDTQSDVYECYLSDEFATYILTYPTKDQVYNETRNYAAEGDGNYLLSCCDMNDNCTETIVIDYSNNTGGGCYIPGSQLIYPEASEVDGNMVITISMDFYGGQKLQRLYNGKYINLELSDIVPAMFPFVLDATYIDSEAELGQDYNYRVLYNVSSIYDTYSPFNKNFTALLNSSS